MIITQVRRIHRHNYLSVLHNSMPIAGEDEISFDPDEIIENIEEVCCVYVARGYMTIRPKLNL